MSYVLFGAFATLLLLCKGGDAYERCAVVADDGTQLGFNVCEGELVCCEKNKAECCDAAGNVQPRPSDVVQDGDTSLAEPVMKATLTGKGSFSGGRFNRNDLPAFHDLWHIEPDQASKDQDTKMPS